MHVTGGFGLCEILNCMHTAWLMNLSPGCFRREGAYTGGFSSGRVLLTMTIPDSPYIPFTYLSIEFFAKVMRCG